ncbi:uncharacterized protein TNCV_1220701 [Trichonephila clavipes]|nr:uncharacterized protein TNCV_1220701 [Trichonephila clavipes]
MIRWARKLAEFNIEWEHHPETQDAVADVLSRNPVQSIIGEKAIRTAVNETTGKHLAELLLGRKLITPFHKLVMVLDGTDFAVGDIERLFEEARRNTKAKHEKWEKYYNRCRRDVQIKVNDWVSTATHPFSLAPKKSGS